MANRLASEPSPYLHQHADNPVDWFPWGDEAFAEARERDLPVLLSVGYSACHWCHVMAHESFEDPATAGQINDSFVPVKVDREERPDVDSIYMEAVQAMTGRGGWPMTVFLTPDGRPFFAGTYFPPRDAHGTPGFRRVLAAVADAWRAKRADIEKQADALAESVRRRSGLPDSLLTSATAGIDRAGAASAGGVSEGDSATSGLTATEAGTDIVWTKTAGDLLDAAIAQISARFDRRFGGIGPAPKFPQPTLLELCMRHHRRTGVPESLEIATETLEAMAAGGIYDHLGGGFARYSTDETWTVPHFEKMLYDQAGLVLAYLHAWQLTGDPRFAQVLSETVDYVLRDLSSRDETGICAAEDADSEGSEGLFYTWTPDELRAAADPEVASAAIDWYGLSGPPNFEGRWILRRPFGDTSSEITYSGEIGPRQPDMAGPGRPDAAGPGRTDEPELLRPREIEHARAQLLAARSRRTRPSRDDKVLTEWNAMFASALAQAAAAMDRSDWADRAVAIGRFLLDHARRADGRFMRSWQEGVARHLGYASDYAWLVDCFTRLYELTGRAEWLDHASRTAHDMLGLFGDERTGALWTTGSDAEEILVRPVDLLDDATPSAASVAATAMLRLGALTGDDHLTARAQRLLVLLLPLASQHPLAVANALGAMELAGGGAVEVVVTGDRPDLLECVRRRYEPDAVLAWGEAIPGGPEVHRAEGVAYVCRLRTCLMPAGTTGELASRLDSLVQRDLPPEGSAGSPPGFPERIPGLG